MAMQFKLVGGGSYVDGSGKKYRTGDVIVSKIDLEKKHNSPISVKFQRMPDLPDEPVQAIPTTPEHDSTGSAVETFETSDPANSDAAASAETPGNQRRRR